MIRVYHLSIYDSCQMRDLPFITRVFTTRVLVTNIHETSLQLRLCTRESRDPRHRRLSVSNSEARTLGTTKSSSSCLMHLSHRCSHAKNSIRVAIWPHCSSNSRSARSYFFTIFRSCHILPQSTCT